MGGKRAAEDQHEILDLLYTKETDRQAKKLAKQVAREERAAKKVPKAAKPKRVAKPDVVEPAEQAPAVTGPTIGAPIGPGSASTKGKAAPTAKQAAKARQVRTRIVASVVAAAAFGGYLYATGYSFDPAVRQDLAACERIEAALPEGDVATAADAETSAASLYRLARFKMSNDLGVEVRRTADSMLRVRTVLAEGTTGSEAQSEMAALSKQVEDLKDACANPGA